MTPSDSLHIVRSYDDDLNMVVRKIAEMGGYVESQVAKAIEALSKRDLDLAGTVIRLDDEVDALEEAIDHLAIRILATRQPVAIDLRHTAMALKISHDLERIGDYAVNISRRAFKIIEQPPIKPLYTIPRMAEAVQAMIKDVLDGYIQQDETKIVAVWHRDDEVDALYNSLFRELLTYMFEDPRHITACTELLFVAKNLERIGDHSTSIAEKAHFILKGADIPKPVTDDHEQSPYPHR